MSERPVLEQMVESLPSRLHPLARRQAIQQYAVLMAGKVPQSRWFADAKTAEVRWVPPASTERGLRKLAETRLLPGEMAVAQQVELENGTSYQESDSKGDKVNG